MRLEGRVWRDEGSRYWLAEVPLLDVMTQGTSKTDALRMIADAVEALVDAPHFRADARRTGALTFALGATPENALVALMLRRLREARGLTLMDVAKRLRSKSPNAYARYEQGRSVPSVAKLDELMRAIDPAAEPILKVG